MLLSKAIASLTQGSPRDLQNNIGCCGCLSYLSEVEEESLLLNTPFTSNTRLGGSKLI